MAKCATCGKRRARFPEADCTQCLHKKAAEEQRKLLERTICLGCGKDDRLLYGGYCDRCYAPR